jgi:hypothetical protein
MNKFKKMKLVPYNYDCAFQFKPRNNLDKEINRIFKTIHTEDIKARLYTNALKKYLFKTFKFKNINKDLKNLNDSINKNDLTFQFPEKDITESNIEQYVPNFEPTITSSPIKESSVSGDDQETTIKNQTVVKKPREKKLQAKKNIKKYYSKKASPKDLSWVNY